MKLNSRICILGKNGLVGSALVKEMVADGYSNLLLPERKDVDLLNQSVTLNYFREVKPEYVFHCAGKVGGLYANDTYRGEFIYENLQIDINVIHAAYISEVTKMVFYGSSTMYPKQCAQPMKESSIFTGPLEESSDAFGTAKLAAMKMCQAYNMQYGTDFIVLIPSNLYGENQNYTPLNCMVIPSLIRRIHEAKHIGDNSLTVWSSGRTVRDFLSAESLAKASLFMMEKYSGNLPVNIGSGVDYSIRELVEVIRDVVEFQGKIIFDRSKIEGAPIKLLDTTLARELGWHDSAEIRSGIQRCYEDFLKKIGEAKS